MESYAADCRSGHPYPEVRASQVAGKSRWVHFGGKFCPNWQFRATKPELSHLNRFFGERRISGATVQRDKILEHLESTLSPEALREFGKTVLRLADATDQDWKPESTKSARPFFSEAARIRRKAINLSLAAIREERRAAIREDVLGLDSVGIPVWSMLLELFKQSIGDAKVSTKSLQIISRVPETTALRMIDRLEEQGLVIRSHSSSDRRVTFVSLTRTGFVKVGSALERVNL